MFLISNVFTQRAKYHYTENADGQMEKKSSNPTLLVWTSRQRTIVIVIVVVHRRLN